MQRLWTHSYAARRIMPQSAMLGLHPVIHARLRNDLYCVEWAVKLYYTIPVIHVPNYRDHYLFTDP